MDGEPEAGGSRAGERGASDRIDAVLADLGGQLEAAEAAELAAEVEDRTRRETALINTVDRLRAAVGRPLRIVTARGVVCGDLLDVGPDWLMLRRGARPASSADAVVPLAAVLAVSGLFSTAVASVTVGPVASRLDLRHVLRGIVRDRTPVRLVVGDGQSYRGVLNRAGADFVEVSGQSPERGPAGPGWLIPLPAIVTVHLE